VPNCWFSGQLCTSVARQQSRVSSSHSSAPISLNTAFLRAFEVFRLTGCRYLCSVGFISAEFGIITLRVSTETTLAFSFLTASWSSAAGSTVCEWILGCFFD